MKSIRLPYLVMLLIVLAAAGCSLGGDVAGPMTFSEASETDLRNVTLLRLTAENFDATGSTRGRKLGFVWGSRLSVRGVIGYKGDYELLDKHGVVFGGVNADGTRWVK
ncbi:hypothetical protein P8631_11890 [Guyparkeria sp. 1SP6A2]|nr:hypothetical protein [Guyparkeria sp. 1SP6A2]